MTDFGLMDGYHVHDGLDQEESSIRKVYMDIWAGHFFFFAAGTFVNDTIWVGSSQSATQHILNIASKFFQINDILINNNKTVAIPINSRWSTYFNHKKEESHRYLDIFLSTESLSKPSLMRAHSNVCFFTNLVLKKAVSDKQFLYLVLVVLHPIVNYRTQFSFVSVGVCNKWDALIHKDLKLKSGLLWDFPSKIASLISFANSDGILGHLFTGMVHIFFDCKLSLDGSLASSFWFHSGVPMSVVLGESLFCKFLSSLWCYGVVFQLKRLDSCGPVSEWFKLFIVFLVASCSFSSTLAGVGPLNIYCSDDFVSVCDRFFQVGADSLSVYMDGLLKNLDMINCRARAAAFFENINLGLDAIVLALECMPTACSVYLFSDSQTALDACRSKSDLRCPDFYNQCWVKCRHIRNVICSKNLRVKWHKVKGHSGISENDYANSLTNAASLSGWYLPSHISEHFLLADGGVVSGNSKHFVHDVFHTVCCVYWEVGSGSGFLDGDLHSDVDWLCSFGVWHPNLHMATGFTSRLTADTRTYFMKALHCQLSVAVQKHIYNKYYSSVLCLYCGEVERVLSGFSLPSLDVLQLLSTCALDFSVSSALFKSFVFNGWL
ncbi:hypothetical protein G9A89_016230 [Geosiphon pyriformis]|nr:hypothetical protein G9A89_016230 [Geosiphon pyriformis]